MKSIAQSLCFALQLLGSLKGSHSDMGSGLCGSLLRARASDFESWLQIRVIRFKLLVGLYRHLKIARH